MVENIKPILQKRIQNETFLIDDSVIPGPSKPRKRNLNTKIPIYQYHYSRDTNYNKIIKREIKEHKQIKDEQFQFVYEILPDADPNYILSLCHQYCDDLDELSIKVHDLIKSKNYPTLKESLNTQELSSKNKQYTIDFNVEDFLNIIPNPKDYFSKTVSRYKIDEKVIRFLEDLLTFICPSMKTQRIRAILKENNYNFIKSFEIIEKETDVICLDSNNVDCLYPGDNLPLLQEIAYCFHKDEIDDFIRKRDDELNMEILQAIQTNSMNTCQCCYSDDILPRLIYFCENGCAFCRDCIVKSTEVAFGEGRSNFPCLAGCNGSFDLKTLQFTLPPKLFSKIVQKKAIADVRAAQIDGLEMCPFCDFAIILPEDDKIFKCLNPECMKQSCRLCKELSHLPLKCDEVEKDDETRARTFIENRMTEALLRECYKCKVKFYKWDGCNLMTCTCGAKMCYICKAPVKSYSHFSDLRRPKKKCPLYSDINKLHKEEVLNMAKRAKQEIDGQKLKKDPTVNF